MQAAQRIRWNHALAYAVEQANRSHLPVIVVFCLTGRFPEANLRHYAFMLAGLAGVKRDCTERGIGFFLLRGDPPELIGELGRRAALVVTDRGYLRIQRHWRRRVADRLDCPLIEVETEAVVPVEAVYGKDAFSAAVLRPRIWRRLPEFLKDPEGDSPQIDSLGVSPDLPGERLELDTALERIEIDRSVSPSRFFSGGYSEAEKRLEQFVVERLPLYAETRNDPGRDWQSDLSPYIHFGQIAAAEVAARVLRQGHAGVEAFLEELIVRRELALNFVWYRPDDYDTFQAIPEWARRTLAAHQGDPRPLLYSPEELAAGKTADPYWNAAQKEMVATGKMHGYMRMYWGKKIIEWSPTPEEAFQTALHLNNRYLLDGRDANGFTGVAWCFGLHDRPWKEREVFGQVRYMNDRGLERKFDMAAYLRRVNELEPPPVG